MPGSCKAAEKSLKPASVTSSAALPEAAHELELTLAMFNQGVRD